MSSDFQKCSRGQVWWVDPGEVSGAVIGKTRPMLVLSDPVESNFGTIVTVAPISTMVQIDSCAHIEFDGLKGLSAILCDQIRTVDLEQFKAYYGAVSDRIMEKVEEGVSKLLHIRKSSITLKELSDTVEKLLQEIPKDPNNMSVDLLIEALEARLQEIKSGPETTKRTRRRWSVEDKLGFLEDSKKMSARELMKKWDLTSNAVHVYKSKFRRELGKTVVGIRSRRAWGEEDKLEFLADAESMAIQALSSKWKISQSSARAYVIRFKNVLGL